MPRKVNGQDGVAQGDEAFVDVSVDLASKFGPLCSCVAEVDEKALVLRRGERRLELDADFRRIRAANWLRPAGDFLVVVGNDAHGVSHASSAEVENEVGDVCCDLVCA